MTLEGRIRTTPPLVPRVGRLVLPLLIVACIDERAGASSAVRDSAGIRIVENSIDLDRLPEWLVSDPPEVRIGAVEGDSAYQLFGVLDATRLASGAIVISNAGTREIRIYDADGKHQLTLGGSGSGPGEYRGLRYIWRMPGDSILAEDFQRSFALYAPDGALARSWPIRELGPFSAPPPIGWLSGGDWIVLAHGWNGAPPRPGSVAIVEYIAYLVRYPPEGGEVDTLVAGPGGRGRYAPCGPDQGAMCQFFLPFTLNMAVAAITADRILFATGQRFEIAVYDGGGSLVEAWRVRVPPRAVTPEDVRRDRDYRLSRYTTDENRLREAARNYDEAPIPETMPAFSSIVVDRAGDVWVELYRPPAEMRSCYIVLDATGRVRARACLSDRLRVFEIGADWVLGLWTDENDVEYVQLHRVRKD